MYHTPFITFQNIHFGKTCPEKCVNNAKSVLHFWNSNGILSLGVALQKALQFGAGGAVIGTDSCHCSFPLRWV